VLDPLLFGQKTAPDFSWDARGGVLPPGATFTRGSSGWYFNSAGVLTQAGTNVARFDYDPSTLVPYGYLAEPQSTNAVTNSQALTGTGWAATGLTVTDNARSSPDGTTDAATLKESSATSGHFNAFTSVTVASGNTYGFSFFAENISGSRWVQFAFSGGAFVNFNPSTGAIGSSGSGGAMSPGTIGARQLPGGRWRFSLLLAAGGSGPSTFSIGLVPASNSAFQASYAGDGTSTIAVWGVQFETAGVGVTSYIPTSGSTVTRSADQLSLPTSSIPRWNPTNGGVLAAVYRLHTNDGSAGQNQDVVFITDGTSNYVECMPQSGSQSGQNASGLLVRRNDLSFQINIGNNILPVPTAFLRRKQAFGWGPTRGQIATDGAMTVTGSGSYVMPSPTTFYIGGQNTGALCGTLETIALYNGARSDAFVLARTQ
jgi:hypothetical protein